MSGSDGFFQIKVFKMSTQAWQDNKCGEITEAEMEEAKALSKGLTFKATRSCTDGYESWSHEVIDYSQIATLIKRARVEG